MLKILITDKIDSLVVDELKKRGFTVQERYNKPEILEYEVQQNEILIVRSATRVTKELIDSAMQTGYLKLIIRAGVGVDNIDLTYAQAKGIRVFNTPNASSISVAELALAHMLVLARKMIPANLTMRQGTWEKNKFLGVELSGKTLGIIGMGRIGQTLAKKASALDMRIIYYDVLPIKGIENSWQAFSLPEVLSQADFVSLHSSSETNNGYVIDEPQLKLMKKSAFLINTARGNLVNEEALLEALNKGQIAGAGLDVFCQEPCKNMALLNHERVSVTPHIAASTQEAQFKIGQEIIRLIEDYQENKLMSS